MRDAQVLQASRATFHHDNETSTLPDLSRAYIGTLSYLNTRITLGLFTRPYSAARRDLVGNQTRGRLVVAPSTYVLFTKHSAFAASPMSIGRYGFS